MASAAVELKTANTGTMRKTARCEKAYPTAPARSAIAMLPPWSKAEFRPSRRASLSFVTRPSVSAETAGAKASPATARMLSAMAIGQKVGAEKMMTPAAVIAAIVRTMTPRLARVTSIAAPIGVWSAMPSKPLAVVTSPTSVWLQCWLVTRNTLTKGPKRLRTSAARKLSASNAYGIGIIAKVRKAARSRPASRNAAARSSFPGSGAQFPPRARIPGFSLTMPFAPLVNNAMRKRADIVLVERGFFSSRARAQAAIAAGLVSVGGIALKKASEEVAGDAPIQAEAPHPWASRGGVKLAAALDAFALDPSGLVSLDVGASTGGFTDVLLARGAAKVIAVDVGRGQFAPRLAADMRVVSLEGLDARALTPEQLGGRPDAIVIDV